MTAMTADQRRMEAAASSVAIKLRAFHEGLTPDEQTAIALALQQIGAGADAPEEDVSGYLSTPPIGTQPSGFGSLVNTVSLITNPSFRVNTLTFSSNATGR